MSESKNGVWGERIIRSLPYVILLLAIWRMASIHNNNEVDLGAGLQALFLALAAIFLKLDLRDRSAVQDRAADLLQAQEDRKSTCHYQIPKESDGAAEPAADEPLPYKPPVTPGATGGAAADATGGKDE
ncbi:hypothetical protein MYRNA_264 [Mycobacterium phage Myrna]|uniref:Uncharacterized protein n=1 Tax=Mycobacterium phage Myrna TaxID=546805 RepID=B5LJN4_9CAUD|nr:membrane protein [Mycobacterium phage Myrna]ACH62231.1 hypothetical protein MYRNA_264 [Mycobacterium phage Myrna]